MSQAATTRVSRPRRPSEKQTQQIHDKEDAAERRIREAERAEKRRRRRQRDEEAENWDPEHDDQDEDEPDIEYSDDEGDTVFTSREVPSKLSAMKLVPSKSKIPPARAPLMPTNGATPHSRTLNQTIRSKTKTPVFRGMPPASPRRVEPITPRITLNLRDDPIPAGYRKSAHLGDNGASDEDEPMYGDNNIQEPETERGTSPSVTASHLKRAHSPDEEIDTDTQIVKAQKLYESQGRPKAKDYDDVTQEILSTAIAVYRSLICTNTPFPDHSQELEFVTIAWRIACKKMGVKLEVTPELVKMVTSRGSHVRGELKTKIRPIIENYGFESGQHKRTIKQNRDLAEELKEGYNFVYAEMNATEANRKGLFRNKNIQKVVNAMWFSKKQDEGVVYHEYFKPLPDVTLALVLTAMECGIDEWGTGIKTEVAFTAVDYRSVFDAHLKCLHDFRDATKKHELLDKICMKLYNVGRFHSGAQPITPAITTAVSANAFAAALKEYEEDSETETDGEDGE